MKLTDIKRFTYTKWIDELETGVVTDLPRISDFPELDQEEDGTSCNEMDQDGSMCTRPASHQSPHVAEGGNFIMAAWD